MAALRTTVSRVVSSARVQAFETTMACPKRCKLHKLKVARAHKQTDKQMSAPGLGPKPTSIVSPNIQKR